MASRVGGILSFNVNGERWLARGNFTRNLGRPKRDGVVGADGMHGYRETPQVPFIEGEITDDGRNLDDLLQMVSGVVILEMGNGKTFVLSDAWFAGEGTGNTEEGNFPVRFEGMYAEEVS